MRDEAAWYRFQAGNVSSIFEGRVEKQERKYGSIGGPENALSMTPSGGFRRVTFIVSRTYKGTTQQQAIVLTGLGGGDCGYDFEYGKEYLVYASATGSSDLVTSICTGTAPLEDAGAKLRLLRGQPATKEDLMKRDEYYEKIQSLKYGTLCGKVIQSDGQPLASAQVVMYQIRDELFPPKTASDPDTSKADGSFCIPDIEAGTYLLSAEKHDYDISTTWMGYFPGVASREQAKHIQIKAGQRLVGFDFVVEKE